MTRSKTRAALACALLATTALASPVLAQSGPPPVRETIDDNGVDLFRGTFTVGGTDLSVGQDQGLSFGRVWRGWGWRDTANGTLQFSSSTSTMSVIIGGRTDRFTLSGSTYTPTEGNGATLTRSNNIYTYTAADGTVATFDRNLADSMSDLFANEGYVTAVRQPSGARLDYTYQQSGLYCTRRALDNPDACLGEWRTMRRLASVKSSYGYQLSFEYYSADPEEGGYETITSVKAVNLTVEACNPAHAPCVTSGPWPKVTYRNPNTGAATDEVIDAAGRTTKYEIVGGRLRAIRRPGSTSDDVTITHDTSGRVTKVSTAGGTSASYAYADSGNTRSVTVTNALAQSTVYTFDIPLARMTSVKDPLGRTTSYQYDANGRLTRSTAPEGNAVQTTYDGRGNATERRVIAKPGSGMTDIVTSASYASTCSNAATCNSPTSTTDPRGQVTEYTYDPTHGALVTVTLPAAPNGVRPQTRYGYSSYTTATGQSVTRMTSTSACQTQSSCAGTADEVKSSITYSGGNVLPTSISTGAGDGSLTAAKNLSYDAIGNLLTVDGPLPGSGDTVRYRYDAIRRRVGTVSADPDGAGPLKHRAQRTMFVTSGAVSKVETGTVNGQSDGDWAAFAPLEAVEMAYDADLRPTVQKLVAGGAVHALTQTSYDLAGRVDCTAVRMNSAAFHALPGSACTLGAEGTQGPDRISKSSYDAAGRVTQVLTAVGTPEQASEIATTYTANGNVATVIDGENNRTTYERDGHDRLAKTFFPSATKGAGTSNPGDYEQLGYDAGSNLVSKRLRDGNVIGYGYDNLSRLVSKDVPSGVPHEYDVSYGYDNLGRITLASDGYYPISFGYDALGRRTSEGGARFGTRTFQHDLAGRRTRLTWQDGFFVTYDHLTTGETTHIRENGAGSGVGVLATFGYDDMGRRTRITRGNGTVTSYGYDPVSRLSQLVQDFPAAGSDLTLTMTHNPAGQIVTRGGAHGAYAYTGHTSGTTGSTANGLNQLVTHGGASLTYDGRGNTTFDGTRTFGYTSENRLATGPGAEFAHDPAGRLFYLSKSNTILTYDGPDLVTELENGTNAVRRRYVHGPGVDEPLVQYEGAGTGDRRFLHADERGSILAVSDSTGNAIAYNAYDEYGAPQPSGDPGRFQYTGQKWLPEVGAYDYKARIYDPKLGGRFLQTDPIGYDDGMNMYAYVRNDPVNSTDPEGTAIETIWDAYNVGVGIGSAAKNFGQGHWGRGVADTLGALADVGAVLLPGVPGGASTAISIMRRSDLARSTYDQSAYYIRHHVWSELNRRIPNGLSEAVQTQRHTNTLVGGRDHIQKAYDAINWVQNSIRSISKNRNLSKAEKDALIDHLKKIEEELKKALKTKPKKN